MSSDPPNTPSSSSIIHHHHQYLHHPHLHHNAQRQPQPQPQSFISPTTTSTTPSPSTLREYRKGNWTLHETLVLITAKKLDDERRTKASSSSTTDPNAKPFTQQPATTPPTHSTRTAELRWKWVENYCWNNGCLRSQNQCNDKWDNLLRDYKKVREYEARSDSASNPTDLPSYWKMEKHQRKERNLPTNLLSQVYDALNEVVHRRYASSSSAASTPRTTPTTPVCLPPPPPPPQLALPPPPPQLSRIPPPAPPPAAAPPTVSDEATESSSETGRVDSEIKRRRKLKNVGSSVMKSASILAQTLMSCEEKKEKRHREIIELERRRLDVEESRNELNREGIAGLISAVNNLSGAIQALVSDRPGSSNRNG